jgi:predicted DNA binding CopG/RHH family protein
VFCVPYIEEDDAQFESLLNDERLKEIRQIARATINDDREKISLRIPRSDLVRIRSRALREGIPYQTLINSILHKEFNR